jgi:hypothetical protein
MTTAPEAVVIPVSDGPSAVRGHRVRGDGERIAAVDRNGIGHGLGRIWMDAGVAFDASGPMARTTLRGDHVCRGRFRCTLANRRQKYVVDFDRPGAMRRVDDPVEATELPVYLLDLLTECAFTVYGHPMPGEREDLEHLYAMGFLVRTFDGFAPNGRGMRAGNRHWYCKTYGLAASQYEGGR